MTPDMVAELLRQLMKEAMILAAPVLIAAVVLSFVLSLCPDPDQPAGAVADHGSAAVAVALILLVGMPWFLDAHGDVHALADGLIFIGTLG